MPSTATSRIDGLTTSVAVKAPCRAVSTTALTLAGEQTVNGVACVTGDRVLYALSGGSVNNGIWVVSSGAWSRAKDFDGNRDVVQGTLVLVAGAASNASLYRVTTPDPIVVGTTAISFAVSGVDDVANLLFDPTAAAIEGSLAAFLGQFNHISKYGALNNDGATDDSAVFLAAVASGDPFIDARGVNCKINVKIAGGSGQVWLLDGATFTTSSSTLTVWEFDGKTDFAMIGDFSIVGGGTTIGTAVGIHIQDCSRWRIDNPTIRRIQGYGIKLDPGSSSTARSDHGVVSNPRIDECYYGWADSGGTGAEYCTVINAHVTRCTAFGVITCAGNIIWDGGHVVDNVAVGMKVGAGSNHAHGMVSHMNLNHNGTFNLHCEQVVNGQTFTGCHFYANDASGNGSIWLDRCKGINISGGHLDCQVFNYKDGNSGLNVIENMYCPGGYGVARRAGLNNGHDQLIIRGCYGAGAVTAAGGGVDTTGVSINDPSTCYAYAERAAGSTQALVSTVAATMLWGADLMDRRAAFDPATGVFTVPAGEGGMYEVSLDAIFTGTAMNAAASFVAARVNGANRKYFYATAFSTTNLQCQGTFSVYLTAGDTLLFEADITGTSPAFGDPGVVSSMSVKRIS